MFFFEKYKNSGFNFYKERLEDYVFLYRGHTNKPKFIFTIFFENSCMLLSANF